MEPWQQELQRQWQVQRANSRLPKCQCCGEPVTSEQYLDLAPFGLNACACQRCVEDNLYENLFEGGMRYQKMDRGQLHTVSLLPEGGSTDHRL